MKRFLRCLSFVLVLASLISIPAQAVEQNLTRGSDYFLCSSVYLYNFSGTTFEAWFSVTALHGMDELGASSIRIQESEDGVHWTTVQTYRKDTYTNLICENTGMHSAYIVYTGKSGYYYRSKVILYAKNENGWAEMTEYSPTYRID